jgi:Na+/H+-dicarboxylate symporter
MDISGTPPKKSKLTLYIIIALVIGIGLGFALNKSYVVEENKRLTEIEASLVQLTTDLHTATDSSSIAQLTAQKKALNKERNEVLSARDKKVEPFAILADIFLRLIKMIVAPLVFTTLVVGVAKLGDINSVGRIGGKTLLWFVGASLTSLMLGAVLVNIFEPGIAMNLPVPDVGEDIGISHNGLSLKEFLYHVFPSSMTDAMAKNEILQIVVFSLFFGVATAAIGDQSHGCHFTCDLENNRLCNERGTLGSFWCHDRHHC